MPLSQQQHRLARLAALLLWCTAAFVGWLPAQPLSLAFQRLGRDQGLSQGTCTFLSRDSRGFVWMATNDGLNRFDGQHVRVYRPNPTQPHSLVGNTITSACFEDLRNGGDLWFTTNNAVHRYVRAFDHFDTIQLKSPAGQRLVGDYYAFHLDPQGQLWLRVGTDEQGYLHCFDTHTGRDSVVCRLNGWRSAVVPDKTGAVRYVLCSQMDTTGLEIIDLAPGGDRRTYFQTDGNNHKVHEVFVENDTLVWLGLSSGIAAFNPQTGALQVYPGFENRPAGDVWSVYGYGAKWLFVATATHGLWVFDRDARRFTQEFAHQPDNQLSLANNEVKNLYVDRQDNLWAAHWNYGFSYVNLRKNKFYAQPAAQGQSIWQFLKGPDGNIWCGGAENGLLVYTPDGRLVDTIDNFFPEIGRRLSFAAPLIFPDNGPLGLYSTHLLRWDAPQRRLQWVKKLPQKILGTCQTPAGETLVTTANGVFKVTRSGEEDFTFVAVPCQAPTQPHNLLGIFADSRGRVYLAENFERLLIFTSTADGLVFEKSVEGTGDCKSFCEKPNGQGAWVATTAGLLDLGPHLEARMLTEATDGLPNATYYGVLPDQSGHLWLPGNQGLLRYDTATRRFNRYLPVDGLFGSEFNTGAFYRADNGSIWAGGEGGLVVFHPDSIRNVPFEPQVQITQILVNDQPLDSARQAEVLESLDLPYAQNTLSFEFVALEFSNAAANQFQYRLVGYDDAWVQSGTRGFARYANLPPGNYTLEILAANSDGVWSATPKVLKIRIQTPFYKTWWFYTLCSLALGGLVYGWFWYRLQQVLKIERLRVQISSDLHDDVGTLLAGLAMQSEALELTAPEKDKSKLRRISEISRNAMGHLRDTVWAIDARKDKVENLLDRMREHAEETLTPRDFRFDIQVGNLSLKQNLPTLLRQNLFLIYKEAITNAAKHSDGDTVLVTLKRVGEGLEMRIFDNGTAPEKAYKTTGQGLDNLQMRAKKMGGTLEISRENGFCVTLRV